MDEKPARWLGGRLILAQPPAGHRVGTDAALLAAAVAGEGEGLDFGAGVGAVGLAFALRNPQARMTLVDNEPAVLALAASNVAANGLAARVVTLAADILAAEPERIAAGLGREVADLVLTNPPFDAQDRGRASPDAARQQAHVMPAGGLDRWLRAVAGVLRPGGGFVMIHRADALTEILAAAGRFGALRLRFVHPSPSRSANRVLVAGRKGSRAPAGVLPPLFLTDADGRATPEAEAAEQGRPVVLLP